MATAHSGTGCVLVVCLLAASFVNAANTRTRTATLSVSREVPAPVAFTVRPKKFTYWLGTTDSTTTGNTLASSGTNARFNQPMGCSVVNATVLFADYGNHAIKQATHIDDTPRHWFGSTAGTSGAGDGPGTAGTMTNPSAIVPIYGGVMLMTTGMSRCVRVIEGTVVLATAIAGLCGAAAAFADNAVGGNARFDSPWTLTNDPSSKRLIVADEGIHRIRTVQYENNGATSTFIGDGVAGGTGTRTNRPRALAFARGTSTIYWADTATANRRIRSTTDGTTSALLVGSGNDGNNDGVGAAATLQTVSDFALNARESHLFLAHMTGACHIRIVDIAATYLYTIAGDGGCTAWTSSATASGVLASALGPVRSVCFEAGDDSRLYYVGNHAVGYMDFETVTETISPARTRTHTGSPSRGTLSMSLTRSLAATRSHTKSLGTVSRSATPLRTRSPAVTSTATLARTPTATVAREPLPPGATEPPTVVARPVLVPGAGVVTVPRRAFCGRAPNASLHRPGPHFAAGGGGGCCDVAAAECAAPYDACLAANGLRRSVNASGLPVPLPSTSATERPSCAAVTRCVVAYFACARAAAVLEAAGGSCPWAPAMLAARRTALRGYTDSSLRRDCVTEAAAIAAASNCNGFTSDTAFAAAVCDARELAPGALPPTQTQVAAASAGFAVVSGDAAAVATAGAGADAVVVRGRGCDTCERSQGTLCGCRGDQQAHTVAVLHASYLTAPPGDACYGGAFEVGFCDNTANTSRSVSLYTAGLPVAAPATPSGRRFAAESSDSQPRCERPNAETGACGCPAGKSPRRLPLAVPLPSSSETAEPSVRNVTFCAPGDITVMVLAADGSGACHQPLGENYTCGCAAGSGDDQQSVALEMAYLNETSGEVMPGVFVVCGAVRRPPRRVTAHAVVATTATMVASAAGGPAAPLIQGAAMVFLMDCTVEKVANAENSGSRSAVVPAEVPVGRAGGWLTMILFTIGAAAVHMAIVGVVTFVVWLRRRQQQREQKSAGPSTADPIQDDAELPHAGGARPRTTVVVMSPRNAAVPDGDSHRNPLAVPNDTAKATPAGDAEHGEDDANDAPSPTPYEHASALLRFPNLTLKACLFGFQGLLYESLVLLRRDDRTPLEAFLGALGCALCTAFTVFAWRWGTEAGRKEALLNATYVEYRHAFAALPLSVRLAVFPRGFWRGTHAFIRRFGALYEAFETRHVGWIAPVHLVRAILISALSAIKPDDEAGCRAVYITLAVVFFVFGLLFLATRPHRVPLDDVVTVFLNLVTGVLALVIGLPWDAVDDSILFLIVVYTALAATVFAVSLKVVELARLRKRELELQAAEAPEEEQFGAAGAEDDSAENLAVSGPVNDAAGERFLSAVPCATPGKAVESANGAEVQRMTDAPANGAEDSLDASAA